MKTRVKEIQLIIIILIVIKSEIVNGDESSNRELYCDVCKKEFTNKSIYESHKSGKKHLKFARQGNEDPSFASSSSIVFDKSGIVGEKEKFVFMVERLISGYMKELAFTREETMQFVDTKQLLTEKERVLYPHIPTFLSSLFVECFISFLY